MSDHAISLISQLHGDTGSALNDSNKDCLGGDRVISLSHWLGYLHADTGSALNDSNKDCLGGDRVISLSHWLGYLATQRH